MRENGEVERETPRHLFLECPSVSNILETLLNYLLPNEYERNSIQTKHLISLPNFENKNKNVVLSLIFKLFFKYIYECKFKKYLPNYDNMKEIISDEFLTTLRASKKLEQIVRESEIAFPGNF